jgi:hypothetical protein
MLLVLTSSSINSSTLTPANIRIHFSLQTMTQESKQDVGDTSVYEDTESVTVNLPQAIKRYPSWGNWTLHRPISCAVGAMERRGRNLWLYILISGTIFTAMVVMVRWFRRHNRVSNLQEPLRQDLTDYRIVSDFGVNICMRVHTRDLGTWQMVRKLGCVRVGHRKVDFAASAQSRSE